MQVLRGIQGTDALLRAKQPEMKELNRARDYMDITAQNDILSDVNLLLTRSETYILTTLL